MNLAAIEPVERTGRPVPAGVPHAQRKPAGAAIPAVPQPLETHGACNFAVRADDPNPLCVSCRLTRVLPDLSNPVNKVRWTRIENAKRRSFYTLVRLGLPVPQPRTGTGRAWSSSSWKTSPGEQVLTGHANGVITVNIAEADDAERERRRLAMHEPYRTLLGHMRHEIGHYYWDRLIAGSDRLEAFRAMFGDESIDYSEALQRRLHRVRRQSAGAWQDRFVTAYATSHPWEDWAETWAHYLHMVDLLETGGLVQHAHHDARRRPCADLDEVVNPFECPDPGTSTRWCRSGCRSRCWSTASTGASARRTRTPSRSRPQVPCASCATCTK